MNECDIRVTKSFQGTKLFFPFVPNFLISVVIWVNDFSNQTVTPFICAIINIPKGTTTDFLSYVKTNTITIDCLSFFGGVKYRTILPLCDHLKR